MMEKRGLVVRTHGGAHLANPITYESLYENRAAQALVAKRKIAAAALAHISPGSVIGLSGGTTCTELARLLRTLESITVVTHAINIALEIQAQAGRRIMVTGGLLNQNSYELVGNQVSQSLQSVHLDIAFVGVSGISSEFGFSMHDEPEAVAGRAFMAAADRTIVLADSTKVGKSTFARLCSIKDVRLLITDDQIDPKQTKLLRDAGLEILIASSETTLKVPSS
jgi:DeoR family transcriptional regulator of aga operon